MKSGEKSHSLSQRTWLQLFTAVAVNHLRSSKGPTTIKMYQIGDKPDNLDKLLENANKILEKES